MIVPVVRRSAFLMLEVMIAFLLMALCLVPLLEPHYTMLQSDLTILEESKIERIVQKLYADFLIKIYNGDVLWSDVDHKDTGAHPREISQEALEGLPYKVHYVLRVALHQGGRGEYSKPSKNTPRNERLNHYLEITYTFIPNSPSRETREFSFNLFAQKELPNRSPTR